MITIDDLARSLPQIGRLQWIGVRSARRSAIRPLDAADLEAGRGIAEDYHASAGASKRQVALVQAEHLDVLARLLGLDRVEPALLRRNLVVSGINLLALRTARFRIGLAELEGTGACEPCSRMEENLGPGGWNAMRGHGGITAKVVRGGPIRIGDEVAFLAPLSKQGRLRRDDRP
jgi:MOSC domain-containing protein YiiM